MRPRFLPLETWPLMQWRMRRARANDAERDLQGLARWADDKRGLIEEIYRGGRRRAARSPRPASKATRARAAGGAGATRRRAFEWLFWAGRITTHSRRGFERLYDLPERVPARRHLQRPCPDAEDAHRELLRMSARALGVATAAMPARLFPPVARRHEGPARGTGRGRRAAAGEGRGLEPARPISQGRAPAPQSRQPARCSRHSIRWSSSARAPKSCSTSATASRSTRRQQKRQYGYYVLPFLLGDRIVARVDLQAPTARPACCACIAAYRRTARARRNGRRTLRENSKLMQLARAGAHGGHALRRPRAGAGRLSQCRGTCRVDTLPPRRPKSPPTVSSPQTEGAKRECGAGL